MKELQLAFEIVQLYQNDKNDLTLLKLQKLAYYCFCFALVHNFEEDVEDIEFEAWKTGAVNRKLHKTFFDPRDVCQIITDTHPAFDSIKLLQPEICFEKPLFDLLAAVVTVYGRLSPRALVSEICRERPWRNTYYKKQKTFDNSYLKQYYSTKSPLPLGLFDESSYLLDNIPIVAFKDIFEVADYLKRAETAVRL